MSRRKRCVDRGREKKLSNLCLRALSGLCEVSVKLGGRLSMYGLYFGSKTEVLKGREERVPSGLRERARAEQETRL